MRNELTKSSVLALSIVVLASCSSRDDDNTEPATEQSVNSVAYIGEWSTGCVANTVNAASNDFAVFDLKITETQWESVMSFYLDDACTVQTDGSLEAGDLRVRGTLTAIAIYTDEGTVTTVEGLDANKLASTVIEATSTLDEQVDDDDATDDSESSVGAEGDVLVYVDEANLLYTGNLVMPWEAETQNSLLLTLPYNKSE